MQPSNLYAHILAFYLVLVMPVLGFIRHRKAKVQMQAGDRLAKVKFLRKIFIKQVINICLLCMLWLFAGVPGELLGLRAPPSWWLTSGLTVIVAIFLVVSGMRIRGKSAEIRAKLDQRAGALLPDSTAERRWFAAVCVGGGTYEELAYRGFLFYYLTLVIPSINDVEKCLITSLVFGIGHLYQGWKGILATGLAGLVMAILYLAGGNLLLPVVAHTLGNLRALWILPAKSSEGKNARADDFVAS